MLYSAFDVTQMQFTQLTFVVIRDGLNASLNASEGLLKRLNVESRSQKTVLSDGGSDRSINIYSFLKTIDFISLNGTILQTTHSNGLRRS